MRASWSTIITYTYADSMHWEMYTHAKTATHSGAATLVQSITILLSQASWQSYLLSTSSSFAQGCGGRVGRYSSGAQNYC